MLSSLIHQSLSLWMLSAGKSNLRLSSSCTRKDGNFPTNPARVRDYVLPFPAICVVHSKLGHLPCSLKFRLCCYKRSSIGLFALSMATCCCTCVVGLSMLSGATTDILTPLSRLQCPQWNWKTVSLTSTAVDRWKREVNFY